MSLVQPRFVLIGAAAVVAISAPGYLLGARSYSIDVPPVLPPTKVTAEETAGLTYALLAPPFDPDRTPNPVGETTAEGANEVPPEAPPAPAPSLVGIVTGGKGRAVALLKAANGETLTLARGEDIDGWALTSIGRDQVTVELGDRSETLRLDFSNQVAAAATASSATPSQSGDPTSPTSPTSK